jgi:hypothetical protein
LVVIMSSPLRSPLSARCACLGAIAALSGVLGACSTPPTRDAPAVACSKLDDLEFAPLGLGWFSYGDETPRAYRGEPGTAMVSEGTTPPPPPPDSPLYGAIDGPCGLESPWLFKAAGHNDWGAGFGTPPRELPAAPDGSDYEGIALWARTSPGHDNGLTIAVNTLQNSWPSGVTEANMDEDIQCTPPPSEDGAVYMQTQDGSGTTLAYGTVPRASDCGNEFARVLVTGSRWDLYLLPWTSFHQQADPRRDANGLDPTYLLQFGVRIGREKDVELRTTAWQMYRHRGWEPGAWPPPRSEDGAAGEAGN